MELMVSPAETTENETQPSTATENETRSLPEMPTAKKRKTVAKNKATAGTLEQATKNEKADQKKSHVIEHLQKWWDEHTSNPYPSPEDKAALASSTGWTEKKVHKWFLNKRVRTKKAAGGVIWAADQRFTKETVAYLRTWYDEHESYPNPTKEERTQIMENTGLKDRQVSQWFFCERNSRKKAMTKSQDQVPPLPGQSKDQVPPVSVTTIRIRFSETVVALLTEWYDAHETKPYPTRSERAQLASDTELTEVQVDSWFKSERKRRRKADSTVVGHRRREIYSQFALDHLKQWYADHEADPRPSSKEVTEIASATGLSEKQVKSWFHNATNKRKKAAGAIINSQHRFSDTDLEYLKNLYALNPYPTNLEKKEFSAALGVTEKQVDTWFNNERKKRKDHGDLETVSNDMFSDVALDYFQQWYVDNDMNDLPTIEEIASMSLATGVNEKMIKSWFHGERVKRRKAAFDYLRSWYAYNEANPYPSREEKINMVLETRLSEKQVIDWFRQERKRKKRAAATNAAEEVEELGEKESSISIEETMPI